MHNASVAARTRTSLHHHQRQRDDAVDCPCAIRQSASSVGIAVPIDAALQITRGPRLIGATTTVALL